MKINDEFVKLINPYWVQVVTGSGIIKIKNSKLHLGLGTSSEKQYSDAQIDDYTMIPRSSYPWKPPLRMSIRARFSVNTIKGTAGFGFWNNPFSVDGHVLSTPESIWFFYSAPPSNMALVPGIPGYGWKAQVIHSARPMALASLIPALGTMAINRMFKNKTESSHWIEKLSGAKEAVLTIDATQWHNYILEWKKDRSIFWVDNKKVLDVKHSPTKPLGFVAWIDNQYAIATADGTLKLGKVDTIPQWLEIKYINIDKK